MKREKINLKELKNGYFLYSIYNIRMKKFNKMSPKKINMMSDRASIMIDDALI